MSGIMGGILMFEAMITNALFSRKMTARNKPASNWNPHMGSIPEKTPTPTEAALIRSD